MKLETYLITQQISPAEFARRLGVRSRTTIHRYLSGERKPPPGMIARIERATEGKVTAIDLLANDNEPLTRRPPPWARKDHRVAVLAERAFLAMLAERDAAERMSPPLRRACEVLGSRVQVDRAHRNFKLDGRPSSTMAIVAAANRILREQRLPEIDYPGVKPLL